MTFTTGHTQYTIYALIDPGDRKVCYVGIAVDVQKRYYEHLHGLCNKYVRQWIRKLQGVGLCPDLQVLDTKKDVKAKIMLIAYLKDIECYKHGWPVGREPCLFTESR